MFARSAAETVHIPDAAALLAAGDRSISSAAAPPIVLEIVGDLAAVEAEWRAFERVADCTAFQSFAWLSAWQCTIGAATATQPAIVVGRHCGRLLFILPLAIERRGPVRRLTWLGSAVCDYNGPLLAPEFARVIGVSDFLALWRKIGETIRATPGFRYDLAVLDKMPRAVGGQPNPFAVLPVMLHPSGAYAAALGSDWDSYYAAKRSSTTRRRDRTKRKGLGQFGTLEFRTAEKPPEIEATLETLFDQKSRALQAMGAPDIFAPPASRAFYRQAAAAPDSPVHVSRLEVGGSPAATNLGLMFRGRYYHVLASYDAGPVSRYGPGAAHLHELMRRAIGQGCTVFDFTIGDEPYKRDWCEGVTHLYDHRSAVSATGWLVALPAAAATATKRFIKQTPVLWSAVTRARSLLARLRGPKPAERPAKEQDEA